MHENLYEANCGTSAAVSKSTYSSDDHGQANLVQKVVGGRYCCGTTRAGSFARAGTYITCTFPVSYYAWVGKSSNSDKKPAHKRRTSLRADPASLTLKNARQFLDRCLTFSVVTVIQLAVCKTVCASKSS